MDFIKSYGGSGDYDFDSRLSEKNIFTDHENKNKLQTSKGYNLNSFFEQSHTRSLVCHKGFISELDAGKILCKVCSVNMDSVLELSEHFQTKSHEDSIIVLIKGNLPPSLLKNMEFITFYDSNLYCNLCKCNISWSSENPFKTIVDIIAHNESNDHLSKKTNNIKPNLQNNDDPLIVLQNLAAVDSMLCESVNLIDYKVQPLFKCKICQKVIEYEENQSQMLINFSLHLNSEGHKKSYKTYLVLKSFEESHETKGESKHKLSVLKDKIFCSCSSRSINPTVECLLAHVNEKSDDDLGKGLSSELSSMILEEPSFCGTSVLSTPSVSDFPERYSDQTECNMFIKTGLSQMKGENNLVLNTVSTLFTKPPPELNIENKLVHNTASSLFTKPPPELNMENNLVHNAASSLFANPPPELNIENNLIHNNVSSLFSKPPPELNGDNNFFHNNIALDIDHKSSKLVQDLLNNLEPYEHYVESPPNVYSVLNRLENTDFFVSRVSKYLTKVSNQVMCDVCDTVISYSSDEKMLKDSIKHHFIGDKHKNFMEKLTFDEKETIVQLTFDNPTIQANKQFIKASGKYLHCMLCQFTLTLILDHENLQRKLVSHCLSKCHLEEMGKPYNSVFESRPSSSLSAIPPTEDSPVNQLKPLPMKRPGQFFLLSYVYQSK